MLFCKKHCEDMSGVKWRFTETDVPMTVSTLNDITCKEVREHSKNFGLQENMQTNYLNAGNLLNVDRRCAGFLAHDG